MSEDQEQGQLVVAVTSSALFDMRDSDRVYREQGVKAYSDYQLKNINQPLAKGLAFPFVSRLLKFNQLFPSERPVEVVLFSRNSAETGLRAFNSITHYGLDISRACFTSGRENYLYLPAYGSTLFLSANEKDVRGAMDRGYAAGYVVDNGEVDSEEEDVELRLAFDFDGVIGDDSSEQVFQREGLPTYQEHELNLMGVPLPDGPLAPLLQKVSWIRSLERARQEQMQLEGKVYTPILRTAIVTARSAPAHHRVLDTLRKLGVSVDEVHFLGSLSKRKVIEVMCPHMFFDDRIDNIRDIRNIPLVHIPFGELNAGKCMA